MAKIVSVKASHMIVEHCLLPDLLDMSKMALVREGVIAAKMGHCQGNFHLRLRRKVEGNKPRYAS